MHSVSLSFEICSQVATEDVFEMLLPGSLFDSATLSCVKRACDRLAKCIQTTHSFYLFALSEIKVRKLSLDRYLFKRFTFVPNWSILVHVHVKKETASMTAFVPFFLLLSFPSIFLPLSFPKLISGSLLLLQVYFLFSIHVLTQLAFTADPTFLQRTASKGVLAHETAITASSSVVFASCSELLSFVSL